VQAFDRPYERFLRHVLGILAMTKHAVAQAEDAAAVTVDKFSDRRLVPGNTFLGQVGHRKLCEFFAQDAFIQIGSDGDYYSSKMPAVSSVVHFCILGGLISTWRSWSTQPKILGPRALVFLLPHEQIVHATRLTRFVRRPFRLV